MINCLIKEGIGSVWTELGGEGDPGLNVHHIQPLYMPKSCLCLLYCLPKLSLPYFAFFPILFYFLFKLFLSNYLFSCSYLRWSSPEPQKTNPVIQTKMFDNKILRIGLNLVLQKTNLLEGKNPPKKLT